MSESFHIGRLHIIDWFCQNFKLESMKYLLISEFKITFNEWESFRLFVHEYCLNTGFTKCKFYYWKKVLQEDKKPKANNLILTLMIPISFACTQSEVEWNTLRIIVKSHINQGQTIRIFWDSNNLPLFYYNNLQSKVC